ncbi:ATPase, histidine kinase-, DNA gyrase B (macronuclear) [Tetrahymena thermophila SB210]|uniref:histidine kinase n=1 Tax=Tetrahymena thermophila (strain SB210) TaxID=312017 RepID=I7LZS0_TETTS|nr:ATPase, histidine kinase-, DNA gyrase B [Tetrahymena thermophila SB210]EAR84804.2 ATPase, histidine kinase-, DNA gyrase B [Tetrahymena thermophila SB210]|eukprot:XP_001032467.2 ATPase, histidine kinase-, DNA gyrase B [Tetrahymena thermophila SB210]
MNPSLVKENFNQNEDANPALNINDKGGLSPQESINEQIKIFVKCLYITINIAFICIVLVTFILNKDNLKNMFLILGTITLLICMIDILLIIKETFLHNILQQLLIVTKQAVIIASILIYHDQEHNQSRATRIQEMLFLFSFVGIEVSRRIQLISFPYIIYLQIIFFIIQDFCTGMAVYFALSCLFIIAITIFLNKIDQNINRLIYSKSYGGQSQDATLTSNHKNLSYFMSFQFNCTTQAAMQPSSYQLNPSIRKLASQTQSHYIHSANINNMIGSGGIVQQNNRIHQTSSNLNFQTQRQNIQNLNIMNENSIYCNSHRVSNNLNNNIQQDSMNINNHSSNNFFFNKNLHSSIYQNLNQQQNQINKNGTTNNPKIIQATSSKNSFQQSIRKNTRMLSNQNAKVRLGQKNKFSSQVGFGINIQCPNCGNLQVQTIEDSIIQQQNFNQSPQMMKSNTVKKQSTLSKTQLSMINDESFYFPEIKQQTIFEEQISNSQQGLPIQIPNYEKTLNQIQKQINIPFQYLIISSQEKKIEIVETNNEDTKKFISEMHIDELTVSLEKFIKMFFDPKYKDILSKNYHICQNQRTSTIYKMIIQDHIQFDNGFLPSPKSKAHHLQTAENNLSENLNLQSQLQQLQQQQQQHHLIQLFPQQPAIQKRSSNLSLSKMNSIVYSMNQNQNIQNLKFLSQNIAVFYFIEVTDVYKEIQENLNENNTVDKEGYKDDLLATVTHDLKNPLNGMVQMLDLCEKEIINQKDITQQNQLNLEKIKEFLSIAQKNTQLLLFLVHDIQDFYQHSKRKLRLVSEQVKIDDLINELNSLFLPQVKLKGIELIFISKLCNDYIYTDGFRLKQIMINLISNAIKYTSRGGVTVSFSNTNKQELFKISISDTGSGIPDNIKNELFKLYQTFDNKKGENPRGVGLGLVISQKLVQEMGPSKQQIQLISEKDKGTTFSFVIFLNLQDKHIYNYCDANSVMSIKTEGCSIEDQELQHDYKNQENQKKQTNQFSEESEQENYLSKNILENIQFDTKQYISHANIPLVSDRFYNMNDLKSLGNKIKQLNSLIQTPSGILSNQKNRFNSSFTNISQNYDGILTNNNQNDHQISHSSQQISLTPKSIYESERNIKTNFEYKFKYNKSPFRNISNPNELSPPPPPLEQGYKIQGILSNNQNLKSGSQYTGNSKSFIKNQLTNSQQNQIQAFQSEINQSELVPSSSKTLYNAIIVNENLKLADKIDFENNIQNNHQVSQQNQQLSTQNLQKSRTPTQKRLNSNGNISSNFTTTLQNPKQNHKKAVRKLSSSYYINNIPQDQSALHSPQMEQNSNEQFIGQLRQLGVKSVLIVDDEPFNIYVMLQTLDFLQKNEFLLEKAYNGKEAADLVQNSPNGYQLIFIDSNMPVMKGTEAIQIIKGINQEIIIVMISGDSRLDEIQNAQQSGADGFLSKPVKLQHIKKEINKIFMQLNQNNLQIQNVNFSSQSELLL